MAIIACPECKGQLSDQAPGCPHCGYVANQQPVPAPLFTRPIRFPSIRLPWLSKLAGGLKLDLSRFWRESKKSMAILAVVMLVAMIAGVTTGYSLKRESQIELLKFFSKAMGGGEGMGFWGILLNNLEVCLLILGAGLWLRALPGIIVGVNGFVVGIVVAVAGNLSGLGMAAILLMLLPHGVFEVPAFVGAAGLGLRVNSWKRLKPEEKVQADDVRWIARCVGLVTILLVVAALIETALIAGMTPTTPPKAPWR